MEDERLPSEAVAHLLDWEASVSRAGSYSSAEAALEQMNWSAVDVLLADIDLPGISGIELIRRVKALAPAVDCMAYTVYDDRPTVFSAIRAGACGYLLKGCTPEELIDALHELHGGGAPMSPRIARQLLIELQSAPNQPAPALPELLTGRELEVLKKVEEGLSYKEIARALALSTHTVHGHIKHVYEKFQAHGRREAVAIGRRLGVL